jgi:hypothetical protein
LISSTTDMRFIYNAKGLAKREALVGCHVKRLSWASYPVTQKNFSPKSVRLPVLVSIRKVIR